MTKDRSELSRRELFTGVFQRFRDVVDLKDTSALPDPKQKEQADIDFTNDRYAQAAMNYEKHLLGQPHDLDARRRLALCLYRQEKFVQCRMECSRALYDKKDDDFALLLLGLANLRMDRTEKAVAALQKFTGNAESKRLVESLTAKLSSTETDARDQAIQALGSLLILPKNEPHETSSVATASSPEPASS
jgi:tetratricopeptide (TPR) repeat protein